MIVKGFDEFRVTVELTQEECLFLHAACRKNEKHVDDLTLALGEGLRMAAFATLLLCVLDDGRKPELLQYWDECGLSKSFGVMSNGVNAFYDVRWPLVDIAYDEEE